MPQFTPVDGDPFAVTLEPVSHDPFSGTPMDEPTQAMTQGQSEAMGRAISAPISSYLATPSWAEQAHALAAARIARGDQYSLMPTDDEAKLAMGMVGPATTEGAAANIGSKIAKAGVSEAPATAEGLRRLYHGGWEYKGGPRWLTTDRQYAQTGYTTPGATVPSKYGRWLQYVDVPHDSPYLQGWELGSKTYSFHAPEELASQLKPFYSEASAEEPKSLGGILAYHGSPHDFEKFDLSKIGTGEGAQAYGHGLYFAEHEPVAQQYRDVLASRNEWQNGPEGVAKFWAHMKGGRDEAIAHIESSMAQAKKYPKNFEPDAIQKSQAAINYLRSGGDLTPSTPGKMYEVNINANPDHFLDWDRPLSEQHPAVTEKLSTILKDRNRTPAEWINSSPGAEQRLRDAGIPGIKYLDQGSRGKGDGSRNYVVFDDKMINIIKKYGLAGLVAGGGAHFALQPVSHNPFEETQ
jgi:hypothetical protein